MKRRIAYILAVITLVSLVLVFATQRSEPARPTGTDTYSDGALGHEGMRDVMKELGVHVLVDRRGAYAFADAPVLFVEPSPRAVDLHGDVILLHHVLLQRAQRGHDSVLVLPKWQPGLEREGPVSRSYKPNVEEVLAAALPSGLVELRREDTDVPETAMLREWTVPGGMARARSRCSSARRCGFTTAAPKSCWGVGAPRWSCGTGLPKGADRSSSCPTLTCCTTSTTTVETTLRSCATCCTPPTPTRW